MTKHKENFDGVVDKAMQLNGRAYMRPVIEKELLHYDILFALDKKGLLDQLTFQGGTCLRLCFGASRFSEDLNFVGGREFKPADLMAIKACIEEYIGDRYGLDVSVTEPKDTVQASERDGVKVNKWQIKIITAPERPDIPKQLIKVEVANIPAYTREARSLKNNYDFLPDGYSDTLVFTESLTEIMADKLIAFPACQRYIRYRDIWDLQWIQKQGGVFDEILIKNKIIDYQIDDYPQRLSQMIEQLPEITHSKEFAAQMSRFLPVSIQDRTLNKEKFYQFLAQDVTDLLKRVQDILDFQ